MPSYVTEEVAMNSKVFNGKNTVRFEIFTAVTMKIAIFWDVTLCASC
jgi:hypothetical protein